MRVSAVASVTLANARALAGANRDGALVGGFHPMQTFGDPVAAMASLPGSTITLEASEPLMSALEVLTQRLGCRVNRPPPGMRGRYHAAAGYTSQFINALFGEATEIWRSWGATDEDAPKALLPMARGTLLPSPRRVSPAACPAQCRAVMSARWKSMSPHCLSWARARSASTVSCVPARCRWRWHTA